MTTATYITIDSRKRASGCNTCDAVYFLDRTLQGVQGLGLSNMQFYNMIYNIANSNSFLLDFATSTMYVVLDFLPQQYAATTSITTPYALGMPVQVHIYISKVVNNYIGVQGGYDMPTFLVPVDAACTIVNIRSGSDYRQYVDISNPIDINRITVKLKSPVWPQDCHLTIYHLMGLSIV